jgi:hypothetical protein
MVLNWNAFATVMAAIALFAMWLLVLAWRKTNPQPDEQESVHPVDIYENTRDFEEFYCLDSLEGEEKR